MRFLGALTALACTSLMMSSVSAQDDDPTTPIVGIWSLGETASCDAGNAWVFFADDLYAEVKLPDGGPSAVGIWRDEGDAIAYTHAHMPFEGHERPMRIRHLTIEDRTEERLVTRNYRGVPRVFNRCPATSLKVPDGGTGH